MQASIQEEKLMVQVIRSALVWCVLAVSLGLGAALLVIL